jgi:hypothetical protein
LLVEAGEPNSQSVRRDLEAVLVLEVGCLDDDVSDFGTRVS